MAPPAPAAENGKAKSRSTPSLRTIFNAPAPAETPVTAAAPVVNEPVAATPLKRAWDEFADLRKSQAAEFQILSREYEYRYPLITITLLNPVEESLLDNFRRELTQFLRDTLRNSELTIASALQSTEGKKVIYTAREKFEHLAGKYPYLNELKDRLGLDWEF